MHYLRGFREVYISCGADGIFHYAKISKHQRQDVIRVRVRGFPPPKWCNPALLQNVNRDGQKHRSDNSCIPPRCAVNQFSITAHTGVCVCVYTSSSVIKNRAIINEQFAVVTTAIGGSEASHHIPTLS